LSYGSYTLTPFPFPFKGEGQEERVPVDINYGNYNELPLKNVKCVVDVLVHHVAARLGARGRTPSTEHYPPLAK
jgi:hypothetical protein